MSVTVSVVVPTFQRPELLRRCLTALMNQDLDPASYEIIVADDAADESTRELVECCSRESAARICYVPVIRTQGPAGARNAGWRSARGAVIAFTDDDCIPEPGWLRAGLAAFAPGIDAAWGRLLVPLRPQPTDYERDAARLSDAEFVTANCFCRRDVLETLGGFDERFTAAWREDSDLHFSLIESGCRLVHAPGAVVVHPIRPAPWGISLKQQRKVVYNALLFKKHRKLYRQRILPMPRHYYLSAIALGAVVAGLIFGNGYLAVAGGAAWMLLAARFCVLRLRGTSQAPRHVAEMAFTSALIPLVSLYWHVRGAVKFRVFFF